MRTVPEKTKCEKAKWFSQEALQIAVKRREGKGKGKKEKRLSEDALQTAVKRRKGKSKGGKERYTHLNADFQRIASRDKKALLSDQCKEIEGQTECGPLEKGMASHFSILALRTP